MRVAKSSEIFTTSAAACRERSVGHIDYSNGETYCASTRSTLVLQPLSKARRNIARQAIDDRLEDLVMHSQMCAER